MLHVFPAPIILPKDRVVENARLQLALGQPSKALLYTWRKRKEFPAFYRSGKNTFYITGEIEKWLNRNGITSVRI